MLNSFQDLTTRFAQVASQPHQLTRNSNGEIGELFEELMVGKIVGNDRGADFAAINTEAKVHYGKTANTTVFTFAPTQGLSTKDFRAEHGKTTVRSGSVTYKGHTVNVSKDEVSIMIDGVAACGWKIAELKERIKIKMPNLAMVFATKHNPSQVTFDRMALCQKVIASRFINSIALGEVVIEHRGDRGIGFRAKPSVIETWFETVH